MTEIAPVVGNFPADKNFLCLADIHIAAAAWRAEKLFKRRGTH
ncbi:hypothetical protein [Pseudomonas trivialis]|nr:hypothetical protein [Pseudomonas trivialis]